MNLNKIWIKRSVLAVLLIFIVAFTFKVHDLYKYDLWFDEIWTDMFSSSFHDSSAELFDTPASTLFLEKIKKEPPTSLYYFIVYEYSRIFGSGKSLRIISVFFSMLSLIVFYKLSRQLFDESTSIYALLIMAFNPFHLWYAQEARVYAMACFFSLSMIYNFIKAIKTDKKFYWVGFTISGIFSLYSSYHSGFLLISTGLIMLLKENSKRLNKWLMSFVVILIFFSFLLPVLLPQLDVVKNESFLPKVNIEILVMTWAVFTLGYSATILQYLIGLFLFLDLLIFGVYCSWDNSKTNTLYLISFLFFPVVAIIIFSIAVMPVYLNRQLLIFSPFLYMFYAQGISNIEKKGARNLVLVCVLVLFATVSMNYYRGFITPIPSRENNFGLIFPKKQYMDVYRFFSNNLSEGDLVVASDGLSYATAVWHMIRFRSDYKVEPFEKFRFYFLPRETTGFRERYFVNMEGSFKVEDIEKASLLHEFSPFSKTDRNVRSFDFDHRKYKRIWLLTANLGESDELYGNAFEVKKYIDDNFKQISSIRKDGYSFDLYDVKDF